MKKLEDLSLEEKIGQLFMVGLLREDRKKQVQNLIENQKIGGVIIYRRNYEDYKTMIDFVNNIKQINSKNAIPIFISIDQEGGRVNRMPSEILNLKGATQIATANDLELIKRSGSIIGKMLRDTGISMDYAPTLDIRRFEENHPIGDRCYGQNKDEVSKYGIEVMKQIQNEKVISVIKHFPGHGSTQKDSHFSIPRIDRKIEELEKDDMVAFENAIKQGADAIMVGHLIIKDVDKKYPASLSKKIIEEYLIKKYNYQGLIITDDLKMMAIRLRYNMKKAALKAIEAGNDIIMLGLPYDEVSKVIKYIAAQVQKGRISIERINKSVEKIIAMKEKYEVNDNKVEGFEIKKINEEIEKINEEVEKSNQKITK